MYGKIFVQIFDGSLYGQWEALVTFQQLIVLANKDGEVDMTPEALSARTSIPLDIIQRGLAQLAAPDPRSRTPDEQGRRIVLLDSHRTWGWRITNYTTYAQIRTAEERRAYFRQYKREKRAKNKADVHNVHQPSTDSTNAVVDTDTKTRTTTTARTAPPSWLGHVCDVYERHYGAGSFPYGKAGKTLKPLHDAGHSGEEIASRFDRYCERLDDIKYLSLAKFKESFAAFADGALPTTGAKNPGAQMVANIMGPPRD